MSEPIKTSSQKDSIQKESKLSGGRFPHLNFVWLIVLVSGFAELSYVIVNISAMPVYITQARHLDPSWIGIMTTAFMLLEGLLKSPFGLLGDRIGRKVLIVSGPAVSVFTALLTPHVESPYVLLCLRIIDGIGAAALWPSTFSLIGDHVPSERRAAAMSQFNLAYLFGLALGPAIGGIINDVAYNVFHLSLEVSKEASFYAAAFMFAVTAILAFLFIPKSGHSHHDPNEMGPGVEGGFNFADFKAMLKQMPQTLLLAYVTFMAVGLVMPYAKLFVQERFMLSESAFGVMMMGPAIVIGSLSVVLGKMTDKFGKAKAVRGGITLCAVTYMFLLAYPTQFTLVALGSIIGLGFVVAFPAWMALVSDDCEPRQRGATVGAVGTAQGLGAISGAMISAFLYKQPLIHLFGQPGIDIPKHGLPFLACGIMLIIAAILALTTVREISERKSE